MTDVVKIVEGIRETCLNRGQDGLLELCKKFDKLEGNSLIFNIPDNIEVDRNLQNEFFWSKIILVLISCFLTTLLFQHIIYQN